MEQVLIKDKKYYGYYVAIKDFNEPVIICYSKDPMQVYEDAIEKRLYQPPYFIRSYQRYGADTLV